MKTDKYGIAVTTTILDKEGKVVATATYDTITAERDLWVIEYNLDTITLNTDTIYFPVGTYTPTATPYIQATLTPFNATYNQLTWTNDVPHVISPDTLLITFSDAVAGVFPGTTQNSENISAAFTIYGYQWSIIPTTLYVGITSYIDIDFTPVDAGFLQVVTNPILGAQNIVFGTPVYTYANGHATCRIPATVTSDVNQAIETDVSGPLVVVSDVTAEQTYVLTISGTVTVSPVLPTDITVTPGDEVWVRSGKQSFQINCTVEPPQTHLRAIQYTSTLPILPNALGFTLSTTVSGTVTATVVNYESVSKLIKIWCPNVTLDCPDTVLIGEDIIASCVVDTILPTNISLIVTPQNNSISVINIDGTDVTLRGAKRGITSVQITLNIPYAEGYDQYESYTFIKQITVFNNYTLSWLLDKSVYKMGERVYLTAVVAQNSQFADGVPVNVQYDGNSIYQYPTTTVNGLAVFSWVVTKEMVHNQPQPVLSIIGEPQTVTVTIEYVKYRFGYSVTHNSFDSNFSQEGGVI